ncbi:MAG TPA: histidine kinase [Chitinophagaceae bacterium]|nr:histidine kinase [Chitinophagaceae bacterium]
MLTGRSWINSPSLRFIQHILFWVLSFYAFSNVFKIGGRPEKIDYVYTALFHQFILPIVYINLLLLVPWFRRTSNWTVYLLMILSLIVLFSWVNLKFFSGWSDLILPDYFFISYLSFFQTAIIFAVYIIVTSLLKLSKSWFVVSELQNELLIAEKQRSIQDKELLELEAKALRAQMNPHFIFNCLNSIKSLIQGDEKHKAIDYLTTFSKLIRTLFQNSDKRQISLFDEIETCRLYIQLEAMRLDGKLCYNIEIVPGIDLKSVMVPALIIQPFIENAIWHGIVPKNGGTINISITQLKDVIVCEVDDDGIGRELSKLNKPVTSVIHKSQGLRLSQARIDLEKKLNDSHASIKIIDKYEDDNAKGTVVVLTFNLN